MSVDPSRLQSALQLLGVELPTGSDHASLADLLGVQEEVLPWLLLRADAFAAEEEISQALLLAASRAPAAATSRPPAQMPSVAQMVAERALDEALGELIRENVERQAHASTADSRLAELERMSAASRPARPQNYVGVD